MNGRIKEQRSKVMYNDEEGMDELREREIIMDGRNRGELCM